MLSLRAPARAVVARAHAQAHAHAHAHAVAPTFALPLAHAHAHAAPRSLLPAARAAFASSASSSSSSSAAADSTTPSPTPPPTTAAAKVFYGVRVGRTPGVFSSYKDVRRSTAGFPGALFRRFDSEAAARRFADSTQTPVPGPDTSAPRLVVCVDGKSRGNPGPAGAGWVVRLGAFDVLAYGWTYLGEGVTGLEAEYRAALEGLAKAGEMAKPGDRLALLTKSALVAEQIKGRFAVVEENLKPLHAKVMGAIDGLKAERGPVFVKRVPKPDSKAAGFLADKAIDAKASFSTPVARITPDTKPIVRAIGFRGDFSVLKAVQTAVEAGAKAPAADKSA